MALTEGGCFKRVTSAVKSVVTLWHCTTQLEQGQARRAPAANQTLYSSQMLLHKPCHDHQCRCLPSLKLSDF